MSLFVNTVVIHLYTKFIFKSDKKTFKELTHKMSIKATVELITEEIEDKIINESVVKKKEKKKLWNE